MPGMPTRELVIRSQTKQPGVFVAGLPHKRVRFPLSISKAA
jgi:hypothetical protein